MTLSARRELALRTAVRYKNAVGLFSARSRRFRPERPRNVAGGTSCARRVSRRAGRREDAPTCSGRRAGLVEAAASTSECSFTRSV